MVGIPRKRYNKQCFVDSQKTHERRGGNEVREEEGK